MTAPPESQLILMDGDPPPVVLKSEKEEIDIFFCPDPSSGQGGLHAAAPDSSDDEVPSSSTVKPSTSSSTTRSKKRTFGSASRNLSKAFDDVPCDEDGVAITNNNVNKARSNLFGTFNASIKRESKALDNEEEEEEEVEEEETTTEEEDIPKPFRASAINTQKDLMLLNGAVNGSNGIGSEDSDQLANDVKLALFSPLKSQCGSAQKWEIPDIGSFSPSFLLGSSDDRFFQLEPDADYNFSLNDSEGIADLFDYKI